uniref:Myb-like domain-containing protein n=1 Tax=Trichuris muris TaxID=70415 RepID=A0A5S6R2Q0_TRIMR
MGKRVPFGITKLISKCIPGGVKIRCGIGRIRVLNIRFHKRATRKHDHYLERSCTQKKKLKDKRKVCTNDIMRKKEIRKENIRKWENANEVVTNCRPKNIPTEKRTNDEQSDKKAKKNCECTNALQAAIVVEQLYKQRMDKRLQQHWKLIQTQNEHNSLKENKLQATKCSKDGIESIEMINNVLENFPSDAARQLKDESAPQNRGSVNTMGNERNCKSVATGRDKIGILKRTKDEDPFGNGTGKLREDWTSEENAKLKSEQEEIFCSSRFEFIRNQIAMQLNAKVTTCAKKANEINRTHQTYEKRRREVVKLSYVKEGRLNDVTRNVGKPNPYSQVYTVPMCIRTNEEKWNILPPKIWAPKFSEHNDTLENFPFNGTNRADKLNNESTLRKVLSLSEAGEVNRLVTDLNESKSNTRQ